VGKAILTALAPLAEMQQYATNLRAITQGRGIYSMEFSHYDRVPDYMADEVIEKAKADEEE
jgi:elongation factor G